MSLKHAPGSLLDEDNMNQCLVREYSYTESGNHIYSSHHGKQRGATH